MTSGNPRRLNLPTTPADTSGVEPAPGMESAIIYARLSLDRQGDKLSVDRQISWGHAEAERRGWHVLDVVTERDKSASKPGTRPGFIGLMERVQAGGVDHVLAWRTDRLWRHVLDQQRFAALASLAGLSSIVTSEGELRIGDDDDEFMAALRALLGGRETKATSRRVAGYMESLASTGQPHTGGRRPFGYEADKVTPRDDEAEAIRSGYRAVLRGESCHAIAGAWNGRGLLTSTGNPWNGSNVARVLRTPRYAGLRSHRGEVLGSGTWAPVVDRETYERAHALLSGRSTGPRPRAARRNLLAGLLSCSVCSGVLEGSGPEGLRQYRCPIGTHVAIRDSRAHTEAVEALYAVVAEYEAEALTRTHSHARAAVDGGGVAEALVAVEVTRARLVELEAMYADGEVTRAEYVRMRDRAAERLAKAEAELRNVPTAPGSLPTLDVLRASWEYLGLADQRATLRAVFRHFVVTPAGKGQLIKGPRLQPVRLWTPS